MPAMSPNHETGPSSRACLNCRTKHLKCNGQMPVCARCTSSGARCVYVQSRRGHRTDRSKPSNDISATCENLNFAPTVQTLSPLPEDGQFFTGQTPTILTDETTLLSNLDRDYIDDDHLIDTYYQFIHPAHPFLLPRSVYLQDRTVFPAHLRGAICFIASHHSSENADIYRSISNSAFNTSSPEDGFKVQSLILLTLASYARFERDLGNQALTIAIDTALRIGLNSNTFASRHNAVFQESWRRTWWELYTITGLISLIGGTNMKLGYPQQMHLPTHCELYNNCQVSFVKTIEEMQHRFSNEGSFDWSSFAYRIEAMRILTKILDITNAAPDSQSDAGRASISGFLLSLPPDKREGLYRDGSVDEIMSCALMIIHLASICLHFPRSGMAGLKGFKTVCGTDRGKAPVEENSTHHVAALRSASAISRLISSRVTLKTLSPCFSCVIAFAAVVQLSECLLQKTPQSDYVKEHIQLELSALNLLGENWPIARVVKGQIAQFSREVFELSPQESLPSALLDEQWLQDLMNQDIATAPQL